MKLPAEFKHLGRVDYVATFDAMRVHNRSRRDAITAATATAATTTAAPAIATLPDEIWILEHDAVFTQGLAGKAEHLLDPGDIPVVKIDRGGQVTYHGPGQLVIYLLLDTRRLGFGVKELVRRIEQSIIDLLVSYRIEGFRRAGMPGVYVGAPATKIAAIGLRVANHGTYHGLSLNVNMDLAPFTRINPCGYPGLAVTQLAAFGVSDNVDLVGEKLAAHLKANLYG